MLGLDLSLTSPGIVAVTQGRVRPALVSNPKTDVEDGDKYKVRIDRIVREVLRAWHLLLPDVVVIEAYAHSRFTSQSTLGEVGGIVRWELSKEDALWVEVVGSTVKKFATGNGRASKAQMLAAAREHFEAKNDDVADAYWLARYGLDHYYDLTETA